jgi:hypothetical protein
MKIFWIKLVWNNLSDVPAGAKIGIGVTAESPTEAIRLVSFLMFSNKKIPYEYLIAEIPSIQELDQKHVIPNMGNILIKGIWFPLGYEGHD